jgi:1-deoxy-D-xylulose-5-phosphate reductoisomerase
LRKNVAILGSTGSIGCSALDVIEHLGDPYRAVALSAHRQADKLLEQVRRHRPAAVAVTQDRPDPGLMREMRQTGAEVYSGPEGMERLVARDDVDVVLAAVVGAAGLPAVLSAVRAGKTLALANKESLVVAGSLLVPEARRRRVPILPVDSEHSAIFQAMQCGRVEHVRRVILTASGGPFRNAPADTIENATLEDALKHPTWRMGNKITIDSATMFNKALELIEACWLFDLPPEKVEVVIHPESIVHSMVEFIDGSVVAQLSPPDMRTPIQYALTYPERRGGRARLLDIANHFTLHFEPPDPARFPALRLAYDVARLGGTAGAVLNAANEAAVEAFSAGTIPFGQIARLVELTIDRHRSGLERTPSLSDLLEADRWARETVCNAIAGKVECPAARKPLAHK